MEGVQRIVLAASRPESVGEPEEVLLVDGLENRRDRLLDDFVLSAQNAQWPFRSYVQLNIRPIMLRCQLCCVFLIGCFSTDD